MVDALNQTALTVLGEPASWAELLGFITGLWTVWLATRADVLTFPVGLTNNIFFGLLFIDARLFADATLQAVYVVLGVIGWWAWLRLGPQHSELSVQRAGGRLLATTAIGVAVGFAILIPVLRAAHGSAPTFDSLTTSLSLGAQLLLSLKRLENWYLWIAADIVYIPLYLSRDLNLTALVYCVFLLLCIRALPTWRRALAA